MSTFDIRVVSLDEFIAVEEAGALPLVGDPDANLIPEDGGVMFYGDGGAGKTTLTIDLGCHLAAGDDWLGIPIRQTSRVLVVENEGPRPLFRAKLRRKKAAWAGSALGDRLSVLEEPWALLSFAEDDDRAALASVIREREIEVVIIGPVTAAGMLTAGTLKEVREFYALTRQVAAMSGRRVTFILIHHENKGGAVSGAWEGVGDSLFHVSLQGHGKTRVYIQKARWSSQHHGTTMQLSWANGDTFDLEDKPKVDEDALALQILEYVSEHPGAGWTRVEEATPGTAKQTRRAVRDRLLKSGRIINLGKDEDGLVTALDHVPERHAARLYLPTDPAVIHLRPAPGADVAQHGDASAPCAPALIGAQGVGADLAPGHDIERIIGGDPGSHIVDLDDWAQNVQEPSEVTP